MLAFLNGVHECKAVIFWIQNLLELKQSPYGSGNRQFPVGKALKEHD